jgi:hypothetical protein
MKSIRVSLKNEVYRRARIRAAELGTTVAALVKKHLVELAGQQSEFDRLRRLQNETRSTIRSFSAGRRLKRADVHDRTAIR